MTWNRKQPVILGIIIFILCALQFLDIIHKGYWYLVGWPLIGIYIGVVFVKDDKGGLGGILFHLFILYCGIYYLVLSLIDVVAIISNAVEILFVIVDFITTGLGWLGFFMYYD
jgi:hypothetical protein